MTTSDHPYPARKSDRRSGPVNRRFILASVIAILLICGIVAAQDSTTTMTLASDSLHTKPAQMKSVPAFDRPDFVIMGNEKVSTAQKNLLNLYNSEAFTERSGVGSRETSPSVYAAPQTHSLLTPLQGAEFNGYAKAGIGRFNSPYAEVWYGRKFPLGDITADVFYQNNKKFESYPGNTTAGFNIAGGSYIFSDAAALFARSKVQGNFAFTYNDFPFAAWSLSQPAAPDQNSWGWYRTIKLIRYGGEMISRDNALFDYQAGLNAEHSIINHRNRLSLTDPDYPSAVENIFSLSVNAGKQWSSYYFSGSFKASAYAFSNEASAYNKVAPFYLTASGYAQKKLSDKLDAKAGIEAFIYRGSWGVIQFRFFPSITLGYLLDPDWDAFLKFSPRVVQTSLSSLIDVDPFVYYPALQHQENRIDLQIGGRYDDKSSLHGMIFFDYLLAYNYPAYSWFDQRSPADITPILTHPYYESASEIISLHATGSKYFSPLDEVQLTAVIRTSKNEDTKNQLTYLPAFELQTIYTRRFAFPLTLRGHVILADKRLYLRYSTDKSLSGYVSVSAEAEYSFTRQFGAFIRITNLFNQQYSDWYGYNAQPFFVMIGLSANF